MARRRRSHATAAFQGCRPAPCWPAAPAERCRDGWKPSRSSRNRGNRASTGCTAIATIPGQEGGGKRAVVVEIARALGCQPHRSRPAVIDEYERDIGPLGQQPDGGPRVRWSPVRTGARLREVGLGAGRVERQVEPTEDAEAARQTRHKDRASGRQLVGEDRIVRGIRLRQAARGRCARHPVGIDVDQRDLGIANVHFEEGEEAPLEIAQVAFQPGKAVSDSGLQPRRYRVSGRGPDQARCIGKTAHRRHVSRDQFWRLNRCHYAAPDNDRWTKCWGRALESSQ